MIHPERPTYDATAVDRLLRACVAYHAATATFGSGPVARSRFLAAAAEAVGAEHAAVVRLSGYRSRRARSVIATVAADPERMVSLATSAVQVAAAGPDGPGAALTVQCDAGRVVFVVTRPPDREGFGPADATLLRLLLSACDPTPLVNDDSPCFSRSLPERIQQVLDQLLAGRSEQEAAAAIGISRHTVHGHVKALYRRHGVNSRAELLSRWVGGTPLRLNAVRP